MLAAQARPAGPAPTMIASDVFIVLPLRTQGEDSLGFAIGEARGEGPQDAWPAGAHLRRDGSRSIRSALPSAAALAPESSRARRSARPGGSETWLFVTLLTPDVFCVGYTDRIASPPAGEEFACPPGRQFSSPPSRALH